MVHTQLKTGSQEMRDVVNELVKAIDTAEDENLGGTLTADADGRAKMATDFFNAATILLKIADGAFAADAATRALFADGIWNAAKLASDSVTTVKILAGNVTGAKLSATCIQVLGGTGIDGDPTGGPVTLTGAAVGDRVAGVINLTDGGTATAAFESVITVVNQIQQLDGNDLASDKLMVTLIKAA